MKYHIIYQITLTVLLSLCFYKNLLFFKTMESAEYDFHQYSLLKLRLSTYVDQLRKSDSIRLDIRMYVLFVQYVLCTVNCIFRNYDFLKNSCPVLCLILSGYSNHVPYIVLYSNHVPYFVLFSTKRKSDFIRSKISFTLLCTVYCIYVMYCRYCTLYCLLYICYVL